MSSEQPLHRDCWIGDCDATFEGESFPELFRIAYAHIYEEHGVVDEVVFE